MTATTDLVAQIKKSTHSKEEEFLAEYFEFLKFKSISTDPEFKNELLACSNWLEEYLTDIGFKVQRFSEVDGHPSLFAERHVSDSVPTVLIYNHYDVQPVDPIELWDSPPFEPTIRDGQVYARGAEDNKGQCFYVLMALRTLRDLKCFPQVNVKLLIEGEEECGSKSLPSILKNNAPLFKADYLFVADVGCHTLDKPAITLGCRGIVSMTVTFTGSATDLHSGEHGGVAINPLHAMTSCLAKIRSDETGEVLIPGFYDNVIEISPEERAELDLALEPRFYEDMFKALPDGGEKKFSPLERAWLRPTLEINGLSGGYAGIGFKTVIPKQAIAKISCRLVANQDPKEIAEKVKQFLLNNTPKGIEVVVSSVSDNGKPFLSSAKSKIASITRAAISDATGEDCKSIMAGGSIPIVAELAKTAEADAILIGFGLPGDQIHAPNEHFGIDRLHLGAASIAAILHKISADQG